MSVAATAPLPLTSARPWVAGGGGLPVSSGNAIRVVESALRALDAGADATLALVLEAEGSTYAGRGAMALFGRDGHVGWLSGGCLEPEIERRAIAAGSSGCIDWLEIDTRDDASLLTGSAVGCRGRLRIALLPLHRLPGIASVLAAWLDGHRDADLRIRDSGIVAARIATLRRGWRLQAQPIGWSSPRRRWKLRILRAPEVLVLGAGPEAPVLVPLLRELGWRVHMAEHRSRWRERLALDAPISDALPLQALAEASDVDAVLVMHHDFEVDREALVAAAASSVPFIGLLGPPQRQADLFKLLGPAQRMALQSRLRAPVGIDLGGRGPETIALSIAAQLQAWRHGAHA